MYCKNSKLFLWQDYYMIIVDMHSFIRKKLFNTLKLIQIQRNVVSGIANRVIVSIMKISNFLHDVWFDIYFLIESKLSNLCILKFYKVLNIMKCRCTDYFPHIAGYLIVGALYPAIFNTSEINSENFQRQWNQK